MKPVQPFVMLVLILTFGARPLKRSIQQYLLNPMAKAIVSGGYGPKDTVHVSVNEEDQIIIYKIPAPEEEEGNNSDVHLLKSPT